MTSTTTTSTSPGSTPHGTVPSVLLGGRTAMPQLGFGVFQVPDDDAAAVVGHALAAGYRSIDTAAAYQNEAGVGRALATSGLARDDLFVTSKLWLDAMGPGAVRPALEQSLERLGLDRLDLYLIHWPTTATAAAVGAWEQLLALQAEGLVSEVGVSNFEVAHLDAISAATGVTPVVNQVELHPAHSRRALRAAHAERGIVTEAWSPLGQGTLLGAPAVTGVAREVGATPAQVILRWHLQHGNVAIPKSATPARIAENIDVLGFTLDDAQVAAIDALDVPLGAGRIGPDPATFNG